MLLCTEPWGDLREQNVLKLNFTTSNTQILLRAHKIQIISYHSIMDPTAFLARPAVLPFIGYLLWLD